MEVARHSSLGVLKVQTRKRRHRAADADALYRAQREARAVHHWRDELGMVRCTVALPPDVGVPFVHRLDAETDRMRRGARREGGSEARAAYAADALVRLVSAKTIGRATTADLVIVCDVRAYRRGHAHDGELCHLLDGGPIPVSVARKLAEGAFIKAVLHDGVRIDTVAHFGRHIPARLRTALEIGPPPEFDGIVCCEEGCGRRYGLEIDHVDPRANDGITSYDNLLARCWPHHQEKTARDRTAGRLGRAATGRAPPSVRRSSQ